MADDSQGLPGWLPKRLADIQAMAKREQDRRASETHCLHDQGTVETLGTTRTGERRLYQGCRTCRRPEQGGKWLPAPDDTTGIAVGFDYRFDAPPCVRCGKFGTELHHFAPRAIFGKEEADKWPTAWLCPECHNFWHRMMEGAA